MSLLSSPQAAPERVWSLIKLLEAHAGTMSRDAALAWLSPAFVQNGQARSIPDVQDGQALGAASSLGLIRREGQSYCLERPPAASYSAFADEVHARLAVIDESDPDFVVLETFAFIVIETERRHNTSWVGENAAEFADAVEHAIGDGGNDSGERRFNSSKVAAWRRWIVLMGLGLDLPGTIGFYPYVAERLMRELIASDLPRGRELPAAEALAVIGKRMPYLDGGRLLSSQAKRTGFGWPVRRISRILSVALRDLHDEGSITLGVRGDAGDLFELAPDGQHPVKTVQFVTLRESPR